MRGYDPAAETPEIRVVRLTGKGLWQVCWVQKYEGRYQVAGAVRLFTATGTDTPDELQLLKSLSGMHAAMGEALHLPVIDSATGQEITLSEKLEPKEGEDDDHDAHAANPADEPTDAD